MASGWPEKLDAEIAKAVAKVEGQMGKRLGDPDDPLRPGIDIAYAALSDRLHAAPDAEDPGLGLPVGRADRVPGSHRGDQTCRNTTNARLEKRVHGFLLVICWAATVHRINFSYCGTLFFEKRAALRPAMRPNTVPLVRPLLPG